jgi:hypothetical protein
MIMATRGCINSPDIFCYICGQFVIKKQRRNITDFVKKAYYAYFGMKVGDQDKSWAPHKVCCICVEELRQWTQGNKKSLLFGIPMIWREPGNHHDDCYFCSCNVQGYNSKNKKGICYPNMPSAMRPAAHGPDIPIPTPPETLDTNPPDSEYDVSVCDDVGFQPTTSSEPQLFTQIELSDLVRDLGLPKDCAEILGSRLQSKNSLSPGILFSWYQNRDKEFIPYFTDDGSLVYCSDISGLICKLGVVYDVSEWRLFIDSSKEVLKESCFTTVTNMLFLVAHSIHLKETYENLEILLNKMKYKEHGWLICGDLKVLCMLLGQQPGNTKCPCFFT